jgi:hypothetical protein
VQGRSASALRHETNIIPLQRASVARLCDS